MVSSLGLVVLASLLVTSHGARILGVFPIPVTSHQSVTTALMKGLAEKGHDVTVVTPSPQQTLPKNYKEIIIANHFEKLMKQHFKGDLFSLREQSSFENILILWVLGNAICELSLPEPPLQELIHSKEKFDLLAIEAFNNECFLGLSHVFDIPVILISPVGSADSLGDSVGNPAPYSHVPDFSLHFNHHMDFLQRLFNTLVGTFKSLGRYLFFLPKQNALMQKHFNGTGKGPLPYIGELLAMTSMVFVNNHVSISDPKPLLPNVIEVGGMHLRPFSKLPQDLQKFMDDSKDGVIFFSMGSNLRSTQLPTEKRDSLLKAFSRLKQRVIWKWETETMPGLPSNVKLSKWLPQSDLLAHPNMKAFITHGGLLSIQEALYHGVPIIGIPIFGDQPMNMKRAELTGYGIKLDFMNISEQSMSEALHSILNKPQYRETAKRLSQRFKDQLSTPLETAIFWTEYVIRHKGAHHLRSASLDLCWFQYHLLDLLGVMAAALYVTWLVFKTCIRCVLPGKKKPTATESKKKK